MSSLVAGTVALLVKPDTSEFGPNLKKAVMKDGDSFDGAGRGAGAMILGGIAAAGIAAGIGAVIKTGFGEAMDASAGAAQLTAGIKSTGNAAHVSVKGMESLASSIEAYSGQTDDSIVKSEQLLLTFTNIKNNGPDKIFDQATKASADMAAKMGGDASASAIMLGKALNDPEKGITALTRVGVTFSDSQKDAVKAMMKTGDTAGAQKIILGELQTEFGGAAKAAGDSLPGQLEKAKRKFEGISQGLVENLLPALLSLSDFLGKAFAFISDNLATVGTFVGILGGFAVAMNLASIATWVTNSALWGMAAALLANPLTYVVIAIAGLIAGIVYLATKTHFFQDVWKAMTGFFKTSVDNIAGWVGSIGDAFSSVFKGIGSVVKFVFDGVVGFIKGYINTIIGLVNGVIDGINGVGGLLKAATGGAIDFKIGHVPKLAEGGIIPATPGGRLVRVAEAGQAEAVIPLSKLNQVGGGATVHYYAARNDSVSSEQKVVDAIRRARLLGAM